MTDEGYIKFEVDWTECDLPRFEEARELLHWRRPLYTAALIGHFPESGIGYGNISIRVGDDVRFLITGTQTGHIRFADASHVTLVTNVDISGNRVSCMGPLRASSESLTHAQLYMIDPLVRAVVHVHSDRLWHLHRDILPTTSAEIPYGTPEMADEFARLYRNGRLPETRVAVMGGHESGIVCIGESMAEAATRALDLHASAA